MKPAKFHILIPLFLDYYLFRYFEKLVPVLLKDGFKVTVVTFDPAVFKKYSAISNADLSVKNGPRVVRFFWNRARRPFYRFALWCVAWVWGLTLKLRYDFAILPWENQPLWYVISRFIPSLCAHNTFDFYDLDEAAERQREGIPKRRSLFKPPTIGHRKLHVWWHWDLDRIMGFRGANYFGGFSGLDYYTVTGSRIEENLKSCNVGVEGSPTQVLSIGNPSYEGFLDIPKSFTQGDRDALRSKLGFNLNDKLFVFFLSPSHFDDLKREEIVKVIHTIERKIPGSQYLLKFHPKIRREDPPQFQQALSAYGERVKLMTEFSGDEHNAKLILCSDAIVQKQSTVGFIAALFGHPIFSYNIVKTDYHDKLYEILDCSWHANSEKELEEAIDKFFTEEGRSELKLRQKKSCEAFCLANPSPCSSISKIIHAHLSHTSLAWNQAPAPQAR